MTQIRISSWNVASSSHYTDIPISRVIPHLVPSALDVICLQELQAATSKLPSSLLDCLHLPTPQAGYDNHNAILTRLECVRQRQLCPPLTGLLVKAEAVQVATLLVDGQEVTIYNCHLPIVGVGCLERMSILAMILTDAATIDGPVVICGDLNTTLPAPGWRRRVVSMVHRIPEISVACGNDPLVTDEAKVCQGLLEAAGFFESFALSQPTWAFPFTAWEVFSLKLDWLAAKNLQLIASNVEDYVSDHRRLNAVFEINPSNEAKSTLADAD